MNMDGEQRARMRKNVIEYYEAHMKAEVFIHRIESSNAGILSVLMYLEKNAARNFSKLNRNSILISGTMFAEEDDWIRCIPQRWLQREFRRELEPRTGKRRLEP